MMRAALRAAAALAATLAIAACAQTPHTHHHRFDDAERWSHVFDDPKRDAWQEPHAFDDARIPEPVDLALFVDVYHHIEARPAYLRRLRASLKPGGRVAVIDFKPDSPVGPPKSSRIARERVVAEMREAGFSLAREHGFLPYQYYLVFAPRP